MASVSTVTREGSFKKNIVFGHWDVSLIQDGVVQDKKSAGTINEATELIGKWVTHQL